MSSSHRILLWGSIGSLLFLSACIMNNVVPELEEPEIPPKPSDLTIQISSPEEGSEISATGSVNITATARGELKTIAIFSIFLNDTLLFDEREIYYFNNSYHYNDSMTPAEWALPNSEMEIKAEIKDPNGVTWTDSLTVHLGGYMEDRPLLRFPRNNHAFILGNGTTVELSMEDYGGSYEEYQFCVATDSLFTDEVCFTSHYSTYQYPSSGDGIYYWRGKVIDDYDIASPWSETRSFGLMNKEIYSTDFLSFSRIERAIRGSSSIYLLGRNGNYSAVMKCDDMLAKIWQKTLYDTSSHEYIDCDELNNGSLYVSVSDGYYSSYDEWLFLLSSGGEELWNREIEDYNNISSVRATSDNKLICGFVDNNNPCVVKMDTTGTTEWVLTGSESMSCYRLQGNRIDGLYQFLQSGNGISYSLGEVDLAGNLNWQESLNVASSDFSPNYVLMPSSDGSFVIGSTLDPPSERDQIYLANMGPTGNISWQTYFQVMDSQTTILGEVHEASDGSLLVVGSFQSSNYSQWDVFLARFDSIGMPIWVSSFGMKDSSEYGKDLVILDDRIIILGYRAGGSTDSPLAIQVDFAGKVIFE